MNYKRHYDAMIERAKSRTLGGYLERHHVIPKCMGGGTTSKNLVSLTPEEHFVAHQLLVKIYPKHRGLKFALLGMGASRKLYGWHRRKISEARTGMKFSDAAKAKMSASRRRYLEKNGPTRHTPESKAKIGAAFRGKKRPPYVGEAVRTANRRRIVSPETRVRLSEATKAAWARRKIGD